VAVQPGDVPMLRRDSPFSCRIRTSSTQIWTPLVLRDAQQSAAARENRNLYLFARLKTGITAKQARADISTLGRLAAETSPDTEKGWGATPKGAPFYIVGLPVRFAAPKSTWAVDTAFTRWDEKAGLQRDAIRSR
jgi:hypothetical protein